MKATTGDAVFLCRIVERICPTFGYHVALTGGCLYGDGERKDIDLLFYSVRQVECPDRNGLIAALTAAGVDSVARFGWMQKAIWSGFRVDIFFPEEPKTSEDGSSRVDRQELPHVVDYSVNADNMR